MRVLAAALVLCLSVSGDVSAQGQRPQAAPTQPAPLQPAPPEAPASPYEPQLLELAEIMGSLAYLRTLCAGKEAATWRERMAALIEAEGRSPATRERLTGAFNSGFRAYAATHRSCTEGSQEASSRLAAEGQRLSRALAGRYGG
jgi:uncharacterized protein (TIGR02301 family)